MRCVLRLRYGQLSLDELIPFQRDSRTIVVLHAQTRVGHCTLPIHCGLMCALAEVGSLYQHAMPHNVSNTLAQKREGE